MYVSAESAVLTSFCTGLWTFVYGNKEVNPDNIADWYHKNILGNYMD